MLERDNPSLLPLPLLADAYFHQQWNFEWLSYLSISESQRTAIAERFYKYTAFIKICLSALSRKKERNPNILCLFLCGKLNCSLHVKNAIFSVVSYECSSCHFFACGPKPLTIYVCQLSVNLCSSSHSHVNEYDKVACRNVLTKSCKKPVEARSRRSLIQDGARKVIGCFNALVSTNFSEDKIQCKQGQRKCKIIFKMTWQISRQISVCWLLYYVRTCSPKYVPCSSSEILSQFRLSIARVTNFWRLESERLSFKNEKKTKIMILLPNTLCTAYLLCLFGTKSMHASKDS